MHEDEQVSVPARKNVPVLLLAAAAFLIPLFLYLVTLAPSLLIDDPGEYQMILPALGVAHPTGYPLYTLLGSLFTRLVPLGDIAWRVNLFSAVAAAACVATLFCLLLALDIAPWLAFGGALAFGLTPDFWSYATMAQTYALNLLLIAAALLALSRFRTTSEPKAIIVLAFCAGCGIAHHSTFWLFVPALALALLPSLSAIRRLSFRVWLASIAAFLIPLSVYAYIPLRGYQLLAAFPGETLGIPNAVVSGLLTPHFLAGWSNVVAGSFYAGSTFQGSGLDWVRALADYIIALDNQFHGFELLALGLLSPLLWRRHAQITLALVAGWLTNVVVVTRGVAAFNEPAGGLFTPTYLFCVVAIMLTLDLLARTWPRLQKPVHALIGLSCLIGLVITGAPQLIARWLPASGPTTRQWAAEQLNGGEVEQGGVILGAWSQVTPLHYLQNVEHVRQDVAVLQAPLLSSAGRDLIQVALAEDKALYLLNPDNTLVPIPLRAQPALDVELQAEFGQQLTLLGYSLHRSQGAPLTLDLFWRVEQKLPADYKVFVHPIVGETINSGHDAAPATEYYPTHLWLPGQVFRDRHLIEDSAQLANAFEIGLYDSATQKRLVLPDGTTSVRIKLP